MTKKGSFIGWICWLALVVCMVAAHVILKQRQVDNYIDMVFVVLYGLLAMYPLSVITKFVRDEGVENARHNLRKIKESVPLPPTHNIKGLNAERKLRQAEADFVSLKNLHDNGLITDEMFSQRKAKLKAALASNEIFNQSKENR